MQFFATLAFVAVVVSASNAPGYVPSAAVAPAVATTNAAYVAPAPVAPSSKVSPEAIVSAAASTSAAAPAAVVPTTCDETANKPAAVVPTTYAAVKPAAVQPTPVYVAPAPASVSVNLKPAVATPAYIPPVINTAKVAPQTGLLQNGAKSQVVGAFVAVASLFLL
ncbi:UNVERIFIED_CONTAM: hypothetical protein HDU68_006662 [Siphonaria sp. JEL0065]|nr:hypothetical protein HDU68_006662 [Siphonaria sp. JEL0065]